MANVQRFLEIQNFSLKNKKDFIKEPPNDRPVGFLIRGLRVLAGPT
jgi:hypothetical protein